MIPRARPVSRSQATAISDGIAAMHREHYGRGRPIVRTLIHQDVLR